MIKKIVLVSFILLVATGLFVFNSMGGFNEVQLEVLDRKDIYLSGRHFRGIPQDEKLAKAFQEIENIKKAHPEAVLHTIYYSEPAGKLDTMEVFVGLESKRIGIETGLETLSFEGENVIVATIAAHPFVMPSPLNIKNKIIAFAKEKGLPEPDLFIDQIISTDQVQVIGIKTNK